MHTNLAYGCPAVEGFAGTPGATVLVGATLGVGGAPTGEVVGGLVDCGRPGAGTGTDTVGSTVVGVDVGVVGVVGVEGDDVVRVGRGVEVVVCSGTTGTAPGG
ncbi:MAG: hypothetical protein ABI251_12275 [Mycobacteriaceae bacterium]